MSFKTSTASPAAAGATSGTITFSYPAGTNAGSFAGYGHKAYARGMNNALTIDDGQFSLSFGASSITFTYLASTSIPANTLVTLQLNLRGQDDGKQFAAPLMKRMVATPLYRIDLGAPVVASSNGISASQSVAAAANFLLNGAVGATLDVPRNVVAAWTTTSILTITGLDEYGDVIIEKSASGTSHTGKKAFKSITSISSSASITSATVGYGDVLGLPVYVDKVARIVAEYQDDVNLARFANKVILPYNFDQVDLLAPTAQRLTAPCAGYVTGLDGTVVAAVTTGGAITVEANTVAVVGLSVTVADAAAAGVQHTDTVLKIPTGLCAAGDDITVTPAAAFATAGRYQGHVTFEPIVAVNGTLVPGVQTAPTATTGDVKGTYDPAEACDGALSFSLVVSLPDPSYKGVDNYDG